VVEQGFGKRDTRLFARGEHSALYVAKALQPKLLQRRFNPLREVLDFVNHAEEAQVLGNRQIPGQRGVDGREIRVRQRARAILREVFAGDPYLAGGGIQDPEDYVDRGGFPRAVGTQQPHDLAIAHVERNAVNRGHIPITFA